MKKFCLSFLIIAFCFNKCAIAEDKINNNQENNSTEQACSTNNTQNKSIDLQACAAILEAKAVPETNNTQEPTISEFDELDALSEQGEAAGIEIKAPAKPSFLMGIVIRLGITFFLNPYITFVEKYRSTKDFVIKYSMVTWEKLFGKKEAKSEQ